MHFLICLLLKFALTSSTFASPFLISNTFLYFLAVVLPRVRRGFPSALSQALVEALKANKTLMSIKLDHPPIRNEGAKARCLWEGGLCLQASGWWHKVIYAKCSRLASF